MTKTCMDCPSALGDKNKSGLCRPCALKRNMANPEFNEKRLAAIRARYKDPAARHKAATEINERHMRARQDPEKAERLRKGIKAARARLNEPEVRAAYLASRAEAGRKHSETRMAWCPPEYRETYFHLTMSKRVRAPEARQMIKDMIAADRAKMTPFERQMEAIAKGAGISTKRPIGSKSYDFTIGGGSPL